MPSKEELAKETPEQREKRLEYHRKYFAENKDKLNKEKINASNRNYQKNSDNWKIYRNTKYVCDCGDLITLNSKSSHKKNAKHLKWLVTNQTPTILSN